MSSECRCHLNTFCFYCEMYLPLERECESIKTDLNLAVEANKSLSTQCENFHQRNNKLAKLLQQAEMDRDKWKKLFEKQTSSIIETAKTMMEGEPK